MPRADDVPQTIGEASEWGWSWLNAKCLSCRHRGQIKFADYLPQHGSKRLSDVARKIVCSKCRARALEFALGTYTTSGGQLWSDERRIEFSYGEAVKPSRE